MISTQPRSSSKGFSLIEVAIALVIFVIGALAIIRIFPGALNAINNNGDQQIATNINRDVLARIETEGALPSATFNVKVDQTNKTLQWTTPNNADHTADYEDYNASIIGVPRFNNTLPTTDDINTQASTSALSHFRAIEGERAQVVSIVTPPSMVPDKYVLTQFPLSVEKINGGINNQIVLPTISQEYTLQNARIDRQGKVTFAAVTFADDQGREFRLSDPNSPPPVVARKDVSAGSVIYVTYRYYNSDGIIWGVREEAVPIPNAIDLNQGASISVSPPTTPVRGAIAPYNALNPLAKTGTIAETVSVRVKNYVTVGAFGPPNSPVPNSPGYPNIDQVGDARRGLIRLTTGVSTSTVSVDYVADWSYMMQQGNPLLTPDATPTPLPAAIRPLPNYRQIALGAPFIEDQTPVGVYSLVLAPPFPQTATSNGQLDVYRSRFGTENPDPAPEGKLVAPTEDDLRQGKVTFIVEQRATKARIAYRTRSSWTQQLSVAASAYKPFVANDREPWRDYYLGGDNYLYFHASEVGKTISVSYSASDANGPLVERPFVIERDIIDTPTAAPAGVPAAFAASGKVSRLKLTSARGANLPDNIVGTPNLISIQGVRGTSITVRTAYINGSKFAQTLLTSDRGTK